MKIQGKSAIFKYANGALVKDRVTGFIGVITARTEFLNGCRRYNIQGVKLQNGLPTDIQGFDEEQLELVEKDAINTKSKKTGGDRPIVKQQKVY